MASFVPPSIRNMVNLKTNHINLHIQTYSNTSLKKNKITSSSHCDVAQSLWVISLSWWLIPRGVQLYWNSHEFAFSFSRLHAIKLQYLYRFSRTLHVALSALAQISRPTIPAITIPSHFYAFAYYPDVLRDIFTSEKALRKINIKLALNINDSATKTFGLKAMNAIEYQDIIIF